MINEADQKVVDDVVAKLSEHFDSVKVFVTRHDGNSEETESYESGGGNFFAQLGQITAWVSIQDQFQRNHEDRKDSK